MVPAYVDYGNQQGCGFSGDLRIMAVWIGTGGDQGSPSNVRWFVMNGGSCLLVTWPRLRFEVVIIKAADLSIQQAL